MGNDILTQHEEDVFIQTKKLKYERSMRNIDSSSFEKVFGVAEERTLRKNQTVPNISLDSVVEE